MKNKNSKINFSAEGGFIKITLIVIGTLVLLKYLYDLDIIEFLTQGKFKSFLDQFYSLGTKGWEKYSEVILKVWNYIIELIKSIVAKIK